MWRCCTEGKLLHLNASAEMRTPITTSVHAGLRPRMYCLEARVLIAAKLSVISQKRHSSTGHPSTLNNSGLVLKGSLGMTKVPEVTAWSNTASDFAYKYLFYRPLKPFHLSSHNISSSNLNLQRFRTNRFLQAQTAGTLLQTKSNLCKSNRTYDQHSLKLDLRAVSAFHFFGLHFQTALGSQESPSHKLL